MNELLKRIKKIEDAMIAEVNEDFKAEIKEKYMMQKASLKDRLENLIYLINDFMQENEDEYHMQAISYKEYEKYNKKYLHIKFAIFNAQNKLQELLDQK